MEKKITTIVVDDSALMRMLIKDMLDSDPDIKVIDTAKNGTEAINKIRSNKPDIITLDMEMPDINGLDVLKIITKEKLTKAIMVTGAEMPDLAYKALNCGAIDFIRKPSGTYSPDIDDIKEELIGKIKAASFAKITGTRSINIKPATVITCNIKTNSLPKVIAIGASTGGPVAIEAILTSIAKGLPAAVLISQHLPAGFSESFARRLNTISNLEVRLGKEGEKVDRGVVFISSSDSHMTVVKKNGNEVIKYVDNGSKTVRPSADKLMTSVADVYGKKAIGVILTGMGNDGTEGMKALKEQGAKTYAQDEGSCAIFSMPKSVIEAGCADVVLPLGKIASEINKEFHCGR